MIQGWPNRSGIMLLEHDRPDLWAVLRKRKLFLVAMAVVGAALALLYVAYVPRNYTSDVQILEDPRGLQIFGSEELTPQSQTSDVNTALIETQLRVLTSSNVLQRVVEREGLAHDPEFDGSERNPVQAAIAFVKGLVGSDGPPVPPATLALLALQEKLRVQRMDRGFVIQLQVTTHDPDKSARLAHAVATTYIEGEAAAKREVARRAGAEVSGRLDDLAGRVKQAEDAVEAFKIKNRLVGANGELVSAQELSALNLQVVAAQARTSELKARADQIQALSRAGTSPDAIAESVRSQTIASLRTQFAEVSRAQADAESRLGPRHPDTQALRDQVQRLRSQIDAELKRISVAARGEYERALANEQAQAHALQAQKNQALNVSQSLVRLRELERKAQASRTVYETYLSRSREIGEQQRVDTGNVRIISPALPPIKPNGPPASLIVLGGALAGLIAAAAMVMLRESMGRRSVPIS
jgi:polysaccharide biosynthesis transport protein